MRSVLEEENYMNERTLAYTQLAVFLQMSLACHLVTAAGVVLEQGMSASSSEDFLHTLKISARVKTSYIYSSFL